VFDLLEHADEEGNVTGGGSGQQRAARVAMKAARPGQLTQADDFYRAFEHVSKDPSECVVCWGGPAGVSWSAVRVPTMPAAVASRGSTALKEVVLRFHKTNIVRINREGKIMLQTGGWYTATTGA
jgi:hypothetical protein